MPTLAMECSFLHKLNKIRHVYIKKLILHAVLAMLITSRI